MKSGATPRAMIVLIELAVMHTHMHTYTLHITQSSGNKILNDWLLARTLNHEVFLNAKIEVNQPFLSLKREKGQE